MMDNTTYSLVLSSLQPHVPTLCHAATTPLAPNQSILGPYARFHDYVIISARRYTAASRSGTPRNALVETIDPGGLVRIGQIDHIIHLEDGIVAGQVLLATRYYDMVAPNETLIWSDL